MIECSSGLFSELIVLLTAANARELHSSAFLTLLALRYFRFHHLPITFHLPFYPFGLTALVDSVLHIHL